MTKPRSIAKLIGAFLALALLAVPLAGPAGANMSAPQTEHSPSTAMATPGPSLAVLSEDLSMTCNRGGCLVQAVYLVCSSGDGIWPLEFVLPEPAEVRATAGGREQIVTALPYQWHDPAPKSGGPQGLPRMHFLPKLYRARFVAELTGGEHFVQVQYVQPWGASQRHFDGYFKGWLKSKVIRYELWPLRGWRLAPRFKLSVHITIEPEAASSPSTEVEHQAGLVRISQGPDQPLHNLFVLSNTDEQGGMTLDMDWGKNFPARLELVVGCRVAVTSYGVKIPKRTPNPNSDAGPEQ